MGITCSTDIREFTRLLQQIESVVNKNINEALSYLGEQCTARIRDRSAEESWIDHTGNLRSSIGYAVFNQGKTIIESAFESVLGASEGTAEGKRYVSELASKYAQVYSLVVVAGMSYADYVEAIDSKDVLASTSVWAASKVNEYLSMAQKKSEQEINKMLK